MPVPARAAYIIVGWYCSQLLVQQQSEDFGGRDKIAMSHPSITPLATACYGALCNRHLQKEQKGTRKSLTRDADGVREQVV
jgi:hypothetical protein